MPVCPSSAIPPTNMCWGYLFIGYLSIGYLFTGGRASPALSTIPNVLIVLYVYVALSLSKSENLYEYDECAFK
jgi:hypothetical protein